MAQSISVTLSHTLGTVEAKKRIAERIELLRTQYIDKFAYSEINWDGDKAALRVVAFGQTVTAQLDVLPQSVIINVQLPWILAALSSKIQAVVTHSGQESLKLTHNPTKS
jgi:hypothetical protein